ncbi:GNAT family N-acetyltransferase [Psychrobacillus vulpis]|uniref:GNAT family N-acetyltransferase n=1 Tax=Psychrobacillus vulpis TaxID=2325572 RepID=A0A544TTF1_9BACI|nr:GNAT family N-acetyltransferase [Psychrobacillus vulpis]TQR20727.1 GNAT family N-acetyltransferase [Psychrobacillus vulpis]
MKITEFTISDIEEIVSLFYDTVHTINSKDYTLEQLNVWAPKEEKEMRISFWKDSLSQHIAYVVKINNEIVGFADLTSGGYLDRLYVHKDYQRNGIATLLVEKLESEARKFDISQITTDASITAKTFFEHKGYKVIKMQTVERKGIMLTNYKMLKKLI